MTTTILRRPKVQARTGLGRTSIYNLERAGKFPKRVTISPRVVGWYEHEIEAWIRARADMVALPVVRRDSTSRRESA